MESINGIPVVTISEVIQPVLVRYGRLLGDPAIVNDIISDMRQAVLSDNEVVLRRFLSEEASFWIGNLQYAYFQRFANDISFESYSAWAKVKCDLLLAIANITRGDDFIIQHILNWEDFGVEVFPFSFGKSFIVDMYELRGLDFFLFHYMGGEVSGHEDNVIFDHAEVVSKSLEFLGRYAEAQSVKLELESKKNRLLEIQCEFRGPEYDPSANLFRRIQISSERFWSNYLTSLIWTRLDKQSAIELVDAFSTEYLIKKEVLSTWSSVALTLCKVIEREAAKAIFTPWKSYFREAVWTDADPRENSPKIRKRVEMRFITFKVLKSCSLDGSNSPTLGQLLFIAKFWNDNLMDRHTNVFKEIREKAEKYSPDFNDRVALLALILEKPIVPEGISINIPEMRNRSAHPREDEMIEWDVFIERFKYIMGSPPVELIKLIVGLSSSSNMAIQQ